MPRNTTSQNITIDGIFDRDHLHEQIIQPNRVFRVTYYFVDYWLPLLKPSTAWLVLALQQSYWQKEKGKITHNRLGKQSGLKRHQVMNLLNDTEQHINNTAPESSTTTYYMSWFLRQIDRSGQAKQGKRANVYTVLLNTPLTPRHQAGLHKILMDISTDHQDIEERLEAIQVLCQTPRSELLDRLQDTASQLPLPSKAHTIEQLVMTACGTSGNHPLRKLVQTTAKRLTDHLLQANQAYLGHQYFREKWISILGSNVAWLLTVIRRHSYVTPDGTEIRNEFTYSRRALADMLGLSERTLRRNIADRESEIKQFIPDLTVNKTAFTGHVSVNIDPLVVDDAKLLAYRRAEIGQNSTTPPTGIGQNSTTPLTGIGQKPTTPPTGIGQNSTTPPTGIGQNSTTPLTGIGQNSTTPLTGIGQNSTTPLTGIGQNSTTPLTEIGQKPTTPLTGIGQNSTTPPTGIGQNSTTPLTGIGQNSTTPLTEIGQNSTTPPTGIGQNSTTESFKALNTSTFKNQKHQQQQHDFDDDVGDSKVLLTEIGIFEPTLSKLLSQTHLSTDFARIWRDWFVSQTEYGVGWVIAQMLANLSPPKKPASRFQLPDNYLATKAQELAEKQHVGGESISPLAEKWHQVIETFRPALATRIIGRILENSQTLSIANDGNKTILRIVTDDEFTQMWLNQRLQPQIQKTWQQMHGQEIAIQVAGDGHRG